MQIVLARLDETAEVVRYGRMDLGERHDWAVAVRPVALMWTNEGRSDDVEKARAYAATEGYTVLTFDPPVRDPLGKARTIMARRAIEAGQRVEAINWRAG